MPPSGLAAQVAGVIGAQQASASQASTSQAPATWTDNNGTVWERTGDRWNPKQTVDNKGFGTRIRTVDGGVETDPVTGLPRVNRIGEVIGAFQPERIYVDPRTGITWLSTTTSGGRESWGVSSTFDPKNPFSSLRPLALGPGSGNIASAMAFMEMYGKPETADEMALLANSNNVSVQDLQREIERYERTMPKLTTLSDRAVAEEEKAFQKQAGLVDEKTGYLTTGRVPDYLIYVPRSEGGPGYRAMTFDERRAYIARTNPNALAYVQRPEQYQQFLQQQPEFGGWKTSALTGGRLNIPAGAGPETPGIRRPYTPPASGRGTGSGASNAMLDRLNALFDRLEAGATDEERRALEAERAARTADLTAKFGGEKTALEEELARRGLYASSIGGGRLGDLGGQQARALAGMEAEILNKQAELAADRQRQLMTGLTSVFGTQAEVEYRAQQLQQEERLRGREMDINEARDRVRAEIDREELKLRRDLGNQTFGLGRDQFIVDLIKAVGSGNVDPETLKKMLEKFGLKYTPGAGDGVKPPPGSDDDPMRGGGNPADPNSWPAGTDGAERSTPDGTVYVYRAALRRWVPKPPPGDNGTTGTQV